MWKSYFALQLHAWVCLQNHFPFPNTDIRPSSPTGTWSLRTCRLCTLHVCCFLCGAFECRAIQGRYSKLVVLVSISWFRIDWWVNIFTLTSSLQPNCAFTDRIVAQLLKMLLNRIYSTFCVSNVSFVRTHLMLFILPHTARNSFVSSLIARIINKRTARKPQSCWWHECASWIRWSAAQSLIMAKHASAQLINPGFCHSGTHLSKAPGHSGGDDNNWEK